MLDKVTVVKRGQTKDFPLISDMTATLEVIPQPGREAPVRPFLHRGDWVDDGLGNIWTVTSALLHEDDEDDGTPYLWHEYDVVNGMRQVR
jgi:hypothetical protein